MFMRTTVGLLLGALANLSHAALITENYQIVLTTAQDIYSAGHVFHISATYDNAGVVAHYFTDGPNSIAEFGAGDDTLDWDDTCAPCADGESLSDAIITISGLIPPPGALEPSDVFETNHAYTYANKDGRLFYLQADSLYLRIFDHDPASADFPFDQFDLMQYWNLDADDTTTVEVFDIGPDLVQPAVVPEPGTVALIGFGFAALVAVRKRQQRQTGI